MAVSTKTIFDMARKHPECEHLRSLLRLSLSPLQKRYLDFIERNPGATSLDLQTIHPTTLASIGTDLIRLENLKLIRHDGPPPYTWWSLDTNH